MPPRRAVATMELWPPRSIPSGMPAQHVSRRRRRDGVLVLDQSALAEQLMQPTLNAAKEAWDNSAQSRTVINLSGMSSLVAVPGAPMFAGPAIEVISHSIKATPPTSKGLAEDLDCSLQVPTALRAVFRSKDADSHVACSDGMLRWVFTCSYNRHASACLNREHVMQPLSGGAPDSGGIARYVQVLVVREGQREDYSKRYGGSHVIVALPNTLRFRYMPGTPPLELCADVGGIGYARLFCQLLAYSMGLPEIWMLDDNVRRW